MSLLKIRGGSLARFEEPLGISSTRTLLESLAQASEPFGLHGLLDDAAHPLDSDEVREEVIHLVQDITNGMSKALTAQDAVDQIVLAIRATQESRTQRLLLQVLWPLVLAIVVLVLTPVADFYITKPLENGSQQEATKQVKQTARETIGDLRLLNGHRFVTAHSLDGKVGPKARSANRLGAR